MHVATGIGMWWDVVKWMGMGWGWDVNGLIFTAVSLFSLYPAL